MKSLFLGIAMASFTLSGLLVSARADSNADPVHNLNQVAFCFKKTVALKKSEYTGEFDTGIPSKSKRVKCAIRASDSGQGLRRIGPCRDPEDLGPPKDVMDDEGNIVPPPKVAAKAKTTTTDSAPYYVGMQFGGDGLASVTRLSPATQRVLTAPETRDYLKNPKAKKWSRVAKGIPTVVVDPKTKIPELDATGKYKTKESYVLNSAEEKLEINIQDPKHFHFVQAFVCTSKKKDFKIDQMTIGDLEDAFGGNLQIGADFLMKSETGTGGPAPGGEKTNSTPTKNMGGAG